VFFTKTLKDEKDIKFFAKYGKLPELQINEDSAKTLYHGTLKDNVKEIQRYGLEPKIGDFVRTSYDLDDDMAEEMYRSLVFMADKNGAQKCLNAIVDHVGRKLGRRQITDLEVINHGALLVFHKASDDWGMSHRDEFDDDMVDHPYTVEPGDYYTDRDQHPDIIMTGKKLLAFLRRNNLWPIEHGSVTPVVGYREKLIKLALSANPSKNREEVAQQVKEMSWDDVLNNLRAYEALSRPRHHSLTESSGEASIVDILKTTFAKVDDASKHIGKFRKLTMPGLFSMNSSGKQNIIRPLRYVIQMSEKAANFFKQHAEKIEQQGWMITSVTSQGNWKHMTLDILPSKQNMGMAFYPVQASKVDQILTNGIVPDNEEPPRIIMGRTPAAARLIGLRNIMKAGWTGDVAIIAVNVSNAAVKFYPHQEYANCVFTYSNIPASALSKSDQETLKL